MNVFKAFVLVIGAAALAGASWFGYKRFFNKPQAKLFRTQKPERRSVYRLVNAEGKLEALGTSKVGPLIQATVKKIFVKEDELIKENQLLAILENDKGGDTDVRQQKALLQKAILLRDYLKLNFNRQESLHKAGQLAQDSFDRITQQYKDAQEEVKRLQASYDKELFIFKQTEVRAPHDGIVLDIPITEGETVSPVVSPPSVICQIAKDLRTMRVTLLVDENRVGDVKAGQQAKISVDTYPYKVWKGIIERVGNFPAIVDQGSQKQFIAYKTIVVIKDDERLLRPGMSAHAKIKAGKSKNVLAVPGYVFQLNTAMLTHVAGQLGFSCKPLDAAKKKELLKQTGQCPTKTLWVVEGKAFIEKAVGVGIDDQAYFEICSGLSENDEVVHDIEQTDEMKALYKKFLGGGL
jgi:HlyD family secretion protein